MRNKAVPTGFHAIRHERLLQEMANEAYTNAKLPEPAVCPRCNAVFKDGHWRWAAIPVNARHAICPACQRQHDQYPAGFVVLEGAFFAAHSHEIMRLVHNHAQYERVGHPLKRIMTEEQQSESVLFTTTDIQLAYDIGEVVRRAYRGELEFHYNPEQNLLRVLWRH